MLSMWMGKYKPLQGLSAWPERQEISSAHLQFNSIQLTCELPWSDLYLKENAMFKSNRRSFDGRASKRNPLTNFHWCKSKEFYAKMNAITPPRLIQSSTLYSKNASIKYAKLVWQVYLRNCQKCFQKIFLHENFWFKKDKNTHQVGKLTSGWIKIKISMTLQVPMQAQQ